jgi:hydroxypyruvate reductase
MIRSEALLRELLDAAIAAAQPAQAVLPHLPPAPRGRTIVLGAGKAAAAMAQAVERQTAGALEGLVVTRYGHGAECCRIEVVEAAHPVPDAAGRAAAARILELAAGAGPDDLVLCLISGGASSLLSLPAAGLTLEDKQAVNATSRFGHRLVVHYWTLSFQRVAVIEPSLPLAVRSIVRESRPSRDVVRPRCLVLTS